MEQKLNQGAETICAIATPSGKGGVSVIRISGARAVEIADSVWRGKSLSELTARTVTYGDVVDSKGNVIDSGLALVMRAPSSFTGENVVEISLHGSPQVMSETIEQLCQNGARVARAGEFTQRAFLNGKLDLTQAEGIIDLIESSSKAARRLAQRQAAGSYSRHLDKIRTSLIDFASMLELELDFSEEDVEFADRTKLLELAEEAARQTSALAESFRKGKVIKEGVPVVIAGCPNAGKSTLLNAIMNEEKAIVSDIPGTTRDVIEDTVKLGDILFRFVDTAGLRVTTDTVERIGVERAYERIKGANIVIWVIDGAAEIEPQKLLMLEVSEQLENRDIERIIVINKADICGAERLDKIENSLRDIGGETEIIKMSAQNAMQVEKLIDRLLVMAGEVGKDEEEIIVTNLRHRDSLLKSSEALRRAVQAMRDNLSADLVAQDVRQAIHHLSALTGTITSDTLLHTIFSRFCIGK